MSKARLRLSVICGAVAAGCAAPGAGLWVGPPEQGQGAEVTVLMLGNSHTAYHDLPGQLDALLRAGLQGRSVATAVAPRWMFLDERLADAPTLHLLESRPWSVVVLQAQKISASGHHRYPTDAAEALIARVRRAGAQPLLFPEWPRRGVDETARIHDTYAGMAARQPACVAPVGQAWDLAQQRLPGLVLHAADGNHAAPAGSYLAALMLYATITGASPLALPDLDNRVDPGLQARLREVAAEAAGAWPPRRLCPQDAPLALAPRPVVSAP